MDYPILYAKVEPLSLAFHLSCWQNRKARIYIDGLTTENLPSETDLHLVPKHLVLSHYGTPAFLTEQTTGKQMALYNFGAYDVCLIYHGTEIAITQKLVKFDSWNFKGEFFILEVDHSEHKGMIQDRSEYKTEDDSKVMFELQVWHFDDVGKKYLFEDCPTAKADEPTLRFEKIASAKGRLYITLDCDKRLKVQKLLLVAIFKINGVYYVADDLRFPPPSSKRGMSPRVRGKAGPYDTLITFSEMPPEFSLPLDTLQGYAMSGMPMSGASTATNDSAPSSPTSSMTFTPGPSLAMGILSSPSSSSSSASLLTSGALLGDLTLNSNLVDYNNPSLANISHPQPIQNYPYQNSITNAPPTGSVGPVTSPSPVSPPRSPRERASSNDSSPSRIRRRSGSFISTGSSSSLSVSSSEVTSWSSLVRWILESKLYGGPSLIDNINQLANISLEVNKILTGGSQNPTANQQSYPSTPSSTADKSYYHHQPPSPLLTAVTSPNTHSLPNTSPSLNTSNSSIGGLSLPLFSGRFPETSIESIRDELVMWLDTGPYPPADLLNTGLLHHTVPEPWFLGFLNEQESSYYLQTYCEHLNISNAFLIRFSSTQYYNSINHLGYHTPHSHFILEAIYKIQSKLLSPSSTQQPPPASPQSSPPPNLSNGQLSDNKWERYSAPILFELDPHRQYLTFWVDTANDSQESRSCTLADLVKYVSGVTRWTPVTKTPAAANNPYAFDPAFASFAKHRSMPQLNLQSNFQSIQNLHKSKHQQAAGSHSSPFGHKQPPHSQTSSGPFTGGSIYSNLNNGGPMSMMDSVQQHSAPTFSTMQQQPQHHSGHYRKHSAPSPPPQQSTSPMAPGLLKREHTAPDVFSRGDYSSKPTSYLNFSQHQSSSQQQQHIPFFPPPLNLSPLHNNNFNSNPMTMTPSSNYGYNFAASLDQPIPPSSMNTTSNTTMVHSQQQQPYSPYLQTNNNNNYMMVTSPGGPASGNITPSSVNASTGYNVNSSASSVNAMFVSSTDDDGMVVEEDEEFEDEPVGSLPHPSAYSSLSSSQSRFYQSHSMASSGHVPLQLGSGSSNNMGLPSSRSALTNSGNNNMHDRNFNNNNNNSTNDMMGAAHQNVPSGVYTLQPQQLSSYPSRSDGVNHTRSISAPTALRVSPQLSTSPWFQHQQLQPQQQPQLQSYNNMNNSYSIHQKSHPQHQQYHSVPATNFMPPSGGNNSAPMYQPHYHPPPQPSPVTSNIGVPGHLSEIGLHLQSESPHGYSSNQQLHLPHQQ